MNEPTIAAAIPTFGRHEVLVNTISALLALEARADELLVLDQTPDHPQAVIDQLAQWDAEGSIRWLKLTEPSITKAMNAAFSCATSDVVIFLDDDIIPGDDLIRAHRHAHIDYPDAIVAGRVLQPWHHGQIDAADSPFRFNSGGARDLLEFMGGNVSIPRQMAMNLGGFDENFVQVAYRFEADFALRWTRSGRRIRYEPAALIHHLKAPAGGTRVHGDHLRTLRPSHSVGEYYFLLKGRPSGWIRRLLLRPAQSIFTRHHLKRPWWIPATLIAEAWGFAWALRLLVRANSRAARHGKLGIKQNESVDTGQVIKRTGRGTAGRNDG